jgi:hypothetical protein
LKVYDDTLDDLQSALKGFTAQVGAAFAPALTELVHGMTRAVVLAKDAFNFFSDGAEKLVIRLSGMVAVIELVGSQMLSLKAFSLDAWKNTVDHIKAIDDWAAAQIKAVDASRVQTQSLGEMAKAHLDAAQAVKTHTDHQKILGEQIVSYTTIQLHQASEANKKYFTELMNLEEQEAKTRYLLAQTWALDRRARRNWPDNRSSPWPR